VTRVVQHGLGLGLLQPDNLVSVRRTYLARQIPAYERCFHGIPALVIGREEVLNGVPNALPDGQAATQFLADLALEGLSDALLRMTSTTRQESAAAMPNGSNSPGLIPDDCVGRPPRSPDDTGWDTAKNGSVHEILQ